MFLFVLFLFFVVFVFMESEPNEQNVLWKEVGRFNSGAQLTCPVLVGSSRMFPEQGSYSDLIRLDK